MKDRILLKLLDPFKGLFERMGVDYGALRSILNIKLLLDSRRTATIAQNPNTKKDDKGDKNNFLASLGLYLLLGLIMIPLVVIGDSYLFQMSLVFGMFMFFMMTSLISDFSSVLLDIRDKDILLSRPINNKTLTTAKFIHIAYYMFMISMALIGPSLIAGLIKKGVFFALIFLLEVILIDLFLIVLTGLLYLFILRFFDGEKLKDIINYVQIGLTITITLGYQLLARVFNFVDLTNIEFQNKFWTYFLPPVWFAAPFEFILKGQREPYIVIYSILALLVPILAIVIYMKTIPIFEANLQKLSSAGGIKKSKNKVTNFIGKLVTRDAEERNFYIFSTNMIKNEREFKLKVYPNLGFGLIFPFLILLPFITDGSFNEIRTSSAYLSIYFTGFLILGIVRFLAYSGNYKGSFIYRVMPIKDMASVYKGALKAVFVNLFTPLFIFEGLVFLLVFGLRILPDLLLAYINMTIAAAVGFKLINKDLPFSKGFEMIKGGKLKESFLAFIIIGALALIHFLALKIPFGVYINIAIASAGAILIWKNIFKEKTMIVQHSN